MPKKCADLTMKEIKASTDYKNISRGYNKSKLRKRDLCNLLAGGVKKKAIKSKQVITFKRLGTGIDKDTFTVPQQCIKDIKVSDLLGSGLYGYVYDAVYLDKGCVVKITLLRKNGKFKKENFEQEVKISTLMGKLDVGPKVYASWTCDKNFGLPETTLGFMVMQKLDTTLEDYLTQNPKEAGDIKKRIFKLLAPKIKKMGKAGYEHIDMGTNNIMINTNKSGNAVTSIKEAYLIDFGIVRKVETSLSADSLLHPYRTLLLSE